MTPEYALRPPCPTGSPAIASSWLAAAPSNRPLVEGEGLVDERASTARGRRRRAESGPGALALETFRRNLPRLMAERPGQWVAYHGDKLIGFAKTPPELYEELDRRGLDGREYVVYCIEPEPPREFDSPYPFD